MFNIFRYMNLHKNAVSPYQFTIFRIIFASYLIIHFSKLLPFAGDLFSSGGLFPLVKLLPDFGFFINGLLFLTSAFFAKLFLYFSIAFSFVILVGKNRRIASLFLCFSWLCLLNSQSLVWTPGILMEVVILIAFALIPNGEPLSFSKKFNHKNTLNSHRVFVFPYQIYWSVWFVLAFSYTAFGLHKLGMPDWLNSHAVYALLQNPLAREVPWNEWLLNHPNFMTIEFNYLSLVLEILFLPLALFSITRKYIWFAVLCLHIILLFMVNFADLTLGVLMMHIFVFDRTWISAKKTKEKVILYFDGVCGLCNHLVDFIQIEEQNTDLYFSPLQSEFAQKNLQEFLKNNTSYETSFLQDATGIYQKSDAILKLCLYMGGIWKLFYIFIFVPKKIRNFIYDIVANNRYKIFGMKDTCRIPTAQERKRFLS